MIKGTVNLLLVNKNIGELKFISQENVVFSWWTEAHLYSVGIGLYLSGYGRPGTDPTEVFLKYMPGRAFHETILRTGIGQTEEDISDQRMTRITYHLADHLETVETQTIRSVGLYSAGYKTGTANKPLTGMILDSPIIWDASTWIYCWYTIEWSVVEAEIGDLTSTRHYMNRLTSPLGRGGTSPTNVWRPSSSYCPNKRYWAQDSAFDTDTQQLVWEGLNLYDYYLSSQLEYFKTPSGWAYPSPINLAGFYMVGKDGSDPAMVIHTNGYKPSSTRVFAHLAEATNAIFFDPIAEDIPEASGFVRISASELVRDDMFGSPAAIRFNFDSSTGVKVGMAKYNLDIACLEAFSTFLDTLTVVSGYGFCGTRTGWRVPYVPSTGSLPFGIWGYSMNQLYVSKDRKSWVHTAGVIGNLSSYRFIPLDDPSRTGDDVPDVIMPGPASSPMTVNTRCITNNLDVFYSKTDRKHKITKIFGDSVENAEMDIIDLDVNFTPILMQLTGSHPANGETDVDYDSFYVDFEYDVDPGTIASSVELLLDKVVVPSTITIDPSNSKRINIVPDEILASDSTYVIRITADIARKRYTPVSGIHFTGNSYLQGSVTIPYSAITLEFFCKADEDMPDEQVNLDRKEALVYWPYTGRSRYINLSADGQINWKSSASEGIISEHLTDSMRFNHFIVVFYYGESPATNCGIYINGKQVLSSVNFEYSGMNLIKIGKAIETGVDYPGFKGVIGEFRIFNKNVNNSYPELSYLSQLDNLITFGDLEDTPTQAYGHRVKMTVQASNVEPLTSFPLMIVISDSSGKTSKDITGIFDELGTSNLKMSVTNAAGSTQYNVDIDKWDAVGKYAIIWASVPIPATANVDFYLWFDSLHINNTAKVGIRGSTPSRAVWSETYCTLHMRETPTDGATIYDSSVHGNNFTVMEPGLTLAVKEECYDQHHITNIEYDEETSLIYIMCDDGLRIIDNSTWTLGVTPLITYKSPTDLGLSAADFPVSMYGINWGEYGATAVEAYGYPLQNFIMRGPFATWITDSDKRKWVWADFSQSPDLVRTYTEESTVMNMCMHDDGYTISYMTLVPGPAVDTAGIGTVTITENTICTGSGLSHYFPVSFKVGSKIRITATGETRVVTEIISNSVMYITSATNAVDSPYVIASAEKNCIIRRPATNELVATLLSTASYCANLQLEGNAVLFRYFRGTDLTQGVMYNLITDETTPLFEFPTPDITFITSHPNRSIVYGAEMWDISFSSYGGASYKWNICFPSLVRYGWDSDQLEWVHNHPGMRTTHLTPEYIPYNLIAHFQDSANIESATVIRGSSSTDVLPRDTLVEIREVIWAGGLEISVVREMGDIDTLGTLYGGVTEAKWYDEEAEEYIFYALGIDFEFVAPYNINWLEAGQRPPEAAVYIASTTPVTPVDTYYMPEIDFTLLAPDSIQWVGASPPVGGIYSATYFWGTSSKPSFRTEDYYSCKVHPSGYVSDNLQDTYIGDILTYYKQYFIQSEANTIGSPGGSGTPFWWPIYVGAYTYPSGQHYDGYWIFPAGIAPGMWLKITAIQGGSYTNWVQTPFTEIPPNHEVPSAPAEYDISIYGSSVRFYAALDHPSTSDEGRFGYMSFEANEGYAAVQLDCVMDSKFIMNFPNHSYLASLIKVKTAGSADEWRRVYTLGDLGPLSYYVSDMAVLVFNSSMIGMEIEVDYMYLGDDE